MTKTTIEPTALELHLAAYLAAVGASLAVSQPAEATIVHYEGAWTATGVDTTLVSFNLAGDVATDGSHVADEQFLFGNQQGSVPVPPSIGGGNKPGLVNNSLFVQGQGNAGVMAYDSSGAVPALGLEPVFMGYQILVGQQGLGVSLPGYGTSFGAAGVAFANQANVAASIRNTGSAPALLKGPSGKGSLLPGKGNFGGSILLQPGEATSVGANGAGSDVFLGLLFDAPGNNPLPGWAEIRIDSADSLSLLAYAYEDTGAPILVGDTGNGGPGPGPVPEPGTLSLLALGATGLAALRRRRRRKGLDQGARGHL